MNIKIINYTILACKLHAFEFVSILHLVCLSYIPIDEVIPIKSKTNSVKNPVVYSTLFCVLFNILYFDGSFCFINRRYIF